VKVYVVLGVPKAGDQVPLLVVPDLI
jgi:hypothetical protein